MNLEKIIKNLQQNPKLNVLKERKPHVFESKENGRESVLSLTLPLNPRKKKIGNVSLYFEYLVSDNSPAKIRQDS